MSLVESSTKTEQIIALLDADPALESSEIARKLCCNIGTVNRARQLWKARNAAPKVVNLDISLIRTDGGTQMRDDLDPSVVAEYAAALVESGGYGSFPPVDVVHDGESYWLWNGGHRLAAAIQSGLLYEVPSSVTQGTQEDAVALACAADARTPLPRDAAAKRRAVRTFLELPRSEGMSIREIADLCGVSHGLVGKMRQERDMPPDEVLSTVDQPPVNGVAVSANGLHVGDEAPPLPGFEELDDDLDEDTNDEAEAQSRSDRRAATAEELREERRAVRVATDDAHLDEVWLAGMPLRSRLPEDRRPGFDRSALRWRRLQELPSRRDFAGDVGVMLKERQDDPACPVLRWLNWWHNIRHPRSWKLCKTCKGHGSILNHPCPAKGGCNGAGFSIIG